MEHGSLYMTRGIADDMQQSQEFTAEVQQALARYLQGDWGELCDEDKAVNEEAIRTGGRIMAAYETRQGKIWIITEWDRSATTILYPSEY